jgi:FAD/FMN-containing dehydrogenase
MLHPLSEEPQVNWTNWSGRLRSQPGSIERPVDETETIAVVRKSLSAGQRVRCVGAAHSHAPLVVTDETLLDLSHLSGVIKIDTDRQHATCWAGTRIADLGGPLYAAGLALYNQGDIDRQAIAGAIATGTHGTGRQLRNLSASVLGARVILADGTLVDCDADHEPDLYEACRLSLGAVGIVTSLRLSLRPAYHLQEKMWLEDLDDILNRVDTLSTKTRHFEFFWLPGKTQAACKSLEETRAEPCYPLATEGSRLARSYEVLANDRPDKHTEMEYSVPLAAGADCVRALREMIAHEFPALAWPIEFRTLAQDDVWMSTAYERPTATISVHQGIELDDGPLFRASEEIFRAFNGRPHWGKVHTLNGDELAECHPRWKDWWRVRDQFDPTDRFLNPYLGAWVGR